MSDSLSRVGEGGKTMPIMLSHEMDLWKRRREQFVHVKSVPWELFGEHGERLARREHGQSLDKLRERGGLGACEAVCVLTGMPWKDGKVTEDQAHHILYAMTALYRCGALASSAAAHAKGRAEGIGETIALVESQFSATGIVGALRALLAQSGEASR